MSRIRGATASKEAARTTQKEVRRTRGASPSQEDLATIRRMSADGSTRAELAKLYGLSVFTITRIVNYRDNYALPAMTETPVVASPVAARDESADDAGHEEEPVAETVAEAFATTSGPLTASLPLEGVHADAVFHDFVDVLLGKDDEASLAVEGDTDVVETTADVRHDAEVSPSLALDVYRFSGTGLFDPKIEQVPASTTTDPLMTIVASDCRMVIVDPCFGRSRMDAQDVFRDFLRDLPGTVHVDVGTAGVEFRERVISDLRNALFHLSRNDIVVVRDTSYRIERVPSPAPVARIVDEKVASLLVVLDQERCPTAVAFQDRRDMITDGEDDGVGFVVEPSSDDLEMVVLSETNDADIPPAEPTQEYPLGATEISADFGPEERRRGLKGFFRLFGRARSTETA